jgi:membrane associated rhomboid family serine protease
MTSPDLMTTQAAERGASHAVRDELRGIICFIGGIWAVFALSRAVPSLDLDKWGVTPRTLHGLAGIASMPFLHRDLHHIVSNTVPLFILLALLAGSRTRSWEVVIDVVILNGALLWLFGRYATHIGASGLIFGLIAFLLVSGFREGRPLPLVIAVVVGLLYGGTLIWGVLPQIGSDVSWDGHLCGAVAGGMVAVALTRSRGARNT